MTYDRDRRARLERYVRRARRGLDLFVEDQKVSSIVDLVDALCEAVPADLDELDEAIADTEKKLSALKTFRVVLAKRVQTSTNGTTTGGRVPGAAAACWLDKIGKLLAERGTMRRGDILASTGMPNGSTGQTVFQSELLYKTEEGYMLSPLGRQRFCAS